MNGASAQDSASGFRLESRRHARSEDRHASAKRYWAAALDFEQSPRDDFYTLQKHSNQHLDWQGLSPDPSHSNLIDPEDGTLLVHKWSSLSLDILQGNPGRGELTKLPVMMHIGKVLVYRLLATFPEGQALNQRRRRAKQLCHKGCY